MCAEKDRMTRTIVDGQSMGAAMAPVTGLHFVDGASGLLLYVVTEKQTSIVDLSSNQLASLYAAEGILRCLRDTLQDFSD